MFVIIYVLLFLFSAFVLAALGFAHYSDPVCPVCGKRHKGCERRMYTRGYNYLCSQAAGDMGWYCMTEQRVVFDQTAEAYLHTLPYWCCDAQGRQGLGCRSHDCQDSIDYFAQLIAEDRKC